MKRRIISLISSIVLICLTILALTKTRVVEAVDEFILQEYRHPGYWSFLCFNETKYLPEGSSEEITVYPVSKASLNYMNRDDFQIFFNSMNNIQGDDIRYVDFKDGTGLRIIRKDSDKIPEITYGSFNNSTEAIFTPDEDVNVQDQYISLVSSAEKNETGINGISYEAKPLYQIGDIYEYLHSLQYVDGTIIISVKDDAANSWNPMLTHMLNNLSLEGGFKYTDSYSAVIDQGTVKFESMGKKRIEYLNEIDNSKIKVISIGSSYTGYSRLSESHILIDGQEYSKQKRGINIVVLDEGKILDSVNFDTWEASLPAHR